MAVIGEVIAGRYELLESVGAGGMSDVYKARDRILERSVALKVLRSRFGDVPELVERFHREARAVARLSHPNIVAVIDRGVADGYEFIAFEFVEGENLKTTIDRGGPLPLRRAIEVALAVAAGLAFAHEQGFVHRDVKPQNILVTRRGEVKVTDFGIARALASEDGMTQTGTVLGTSAYLAPEQASGRRVTPAADVYSLAVVLYELLTGEVPFAGDNFVSIAMKHLNEPPPSLLERRRDTPRRLAAAVEHALAKDAADRFDSMAGFAAELQACLDALAEPDGEPTLITTIPLAVEASSARRRRIRSRGPLLAGLLALLAAAAVVGVLESGGSRRGVPGGGGAGTATAVSLRGIGDYDPSGPPDTHADTAPLATSSGSTTGWYTQIYATPEFGDLMPGLGLLLDAGQATRVARITLSTPTPGFVATVLAGDSPHGTFTADSAPETAGPTTTFALDRLTARYYVLWITRLPPGDKAQVTDLSASR